MEHELIEKAKAFAENAHKGQYRKWVMDGLGSRIPYFSHPCRVAEAVQIHPACTVEMVAAAYLHDVIEDCGITHEQLVACFGKKIADLVRELTNEKDDRAPHMKAPREVRKAYDRVRLEKVSSEAKIIKMLDRLDNLNEMHDTPSSFRRKYAYEALSLAGVIGDADSVLRWRLIDMAIITLREVDAKPTDVDTKAT
jgi:(p)ppGpp synthase/HD superfamily hydrolase